MRPFLIKFLSTFKNLFLLIYNLINKIELKLTKNNNLNIISLNYNENGRYYQYILSNKDLLNHQDVLKSIYNTLMSDDKFINFGKYKVIIVSGISNDEEFNFHHNVLITNNSSFEQYYDKVKYIISTHFEYGYPIDTIPYFKILV